MASRRDVAIKHRSFQGTERQDDFEGGSGRLLRAQNFYEAVEGKLYKRPGGTDFLSSADLYGAAGVTGVHRHYNPGGEKISIFHCRPNATPIAQPTTDLVLTEVAGGDLFDGGAVTALRFCYSWVGLGAESTYNSKSRTGYLNTVDLDAWNQPGHQSITVSNNTRAVQVTVPAFPSGVRSANIFMARGTSTQMTLVGVVRTSGGSITVKHFIAANSAAGLDAPRLLQLTATTTAGGTLPRGQYLVSVAWLVNATRKENPSTLVAATPQLSDDVAVYLRAGENAITVSYTGAASTNGAKCAYVFVSRKDVLDGPMMLVGTIKLGETLTIEEFPSGSNAQSHPFNISGAGATRAYFNPICLSSDFVNTSRFGFLLKKTGSVVSEILPSRTCVLQAEIPVYVGAAILTAGTGIFRSTEILTDSDTTIGTTDRTGYANPSFAYLDGLSYFANGVQIPWQTDGYCLGSLTEVYNTHLPPYPRFLLVFKSQLIAGGADAANQLYASNSNAPRSWVSTGVGTTLRFITIGDPFGDAVSASGVFSYTTGTTGPQGLLVGFKGNTCWTAGDIPDPASGVYPSMSQASGQVGCKAHQTVKNTAVGLMFLSSDGNVYTIRGTGEPAPVGGSISPLLSHLVGNDDLMRLCHAAVHGGHYKLAYPSSESSTYCDAQLWARIPKRPNEPVKWTGPHLGQSILAQSVNAGEDDDQFRICARADAVGVFRAEDPSTFQDFGSPIVSIAESLPIRARDEAHLKRIIGLLVELFYDTAFSHSVLSEFFADAEYAQSNKVLSTGGATWDASNFDAGLWSDATFFPVRFNLGDTNLLGSVLRWRITHSDNAQLILRTAELVVQGERREII